MRSVAILLVLVAGGCGSSRGVRTPAHAPGSEGGAAVVRVVERAADDVCRCGDGWCADEVVERLRVGLGRLGDVMLTTPEQSAMGHAVARIDRCRARLFGRGEQAARVAERWADETCACADASCRDLAAQRGAEELGRYGDAQASEAEVRRIVVAARRVKRCLRDQDRTQR